MDITPLVEKDKKIIKSYGTDLFRISDNSTIEGSMLLYNHICCQWKIDSIESINIDSLSPLIDSINDIEILLIGTGDTHHNLPNKLQIELQAKNIATEMMTTPAACRTYNVLISEGRNVAGAFANFISDKI